MDLDTDKLRSAAYGLRNIGDRIHEEVSDATDNLDDAGEGNDGFSAVSKLKSAVDEWVPAAGRVATRMRDTADSIETSANSFDGTDEDNSSQLCESGGSQGYPDPPYSDQGPPYTPLND